MMYNDSLQPPLMIVDPLEVETQTHKPKNLFLAQIGNLPSGSNNLYSFKLEEMGLLEEEWSGAGIADMVWNEKEEEEVGGQPLHHLHQDDQQLLQEVKGGDDPALASSNDLLKNFGPLRIGVLENGR